MYLHSWQYPLYVPPSHLDDIKVKINTTKVRTMTETELPISKRIVIFGATGDLAKRKLIPALYQLWTKNLLPPNLLIVGASRRYYTRECWMRMLGSTEQLCTHFLLALMKGR